MKYIFLILAFFVGFYCEKIIIPIKDFDTLLVYPCTSDDSTKLLQEAFNYKGNIRLVSGNYSVSKNVDVNKEIKSGFRTERK